MNQVCLLLALFLVVASASRCDTVANLTGKQNMIPIDVSKPVFVRSVINGELYTVGNTTAANGDDQQILLLHLYGTNGYDYGYAAGQLIGNEINETLSAAWAYFQKQLSKEVAGVTKKYHLSPETIGMIAKWGLEFFLDWQNDECERFSDNQIYAEMHGLADASGVDYKLIRRVHMIGELTKGQCSYYGAYGEATLGNKVLQLRALDWNTGAGLENHPLVTVYHPKNPAMGVPFVNVGWAGWVGVLTGFNANGIGISEIGVSYPNFPPAFGSESRSGVPFIFLMRSILQHATSYSDAENMINEAKRTAHLILGVGDAHSDHAIMVQYSATVVRYFNDTNLEPLASWHPRLENVVYAGMDWYCPFYQHAMYQQLQASHGKLTPELSIQNITSVVETGDLHVAVYDLTDLQLYVANHSPDSSTSVLKEGYERQFVKIDMQTEFTRPFGGH